MFRDIEDAIKVAQKANMLYNLYRRHENYNYAALIAVIARDHAIAHIAACAFRGERIKEFVNEIHALWAPALTRTTK